MLSTVRRSSKFNKGLALSISLPKVLAKKILIALYGFVLFGFSLYVPCIHCPTLKYYKRCMGKLNEAHEEELFMKTTLFLILSVTVFYCRCHPLD